MICVFFLYVSHSKLAHFGPCNEQSERLFLVAVSFLVASFEHTMLSYLLAAAMAAILHPANFCIWMSLGTFYFSF